MLADASWGVYETFQRGSAHVPLICMYIVVVIWGVILLMAAERSNNTWHDLCRVLCEQPAQRRLPPAIVVKEC